MLHKRATYTLSSIKDAFQLKMKTNYADGIWRMNLLIKKKKENASTISYSQKILKVDNLEYGSVYVLFN